MKVQKRMHFGLLLNFLLNVNQANAEWINKDPHADDPFEAGHKTVSEVIDAGIEFGFECKLNKEYKIFLQTRVDDGSKKVSPDTVRNSNKEGTWHTLRLRFDDELAISLPVKLIKIDEHQRIFSTTDVSDLPDIPETKQRPGHLLDDIVKRFDIDKSYEDSKERIIEGLRNVKNRILVGIDQEIKILPVQNAAQSMNISMEACGIKSNSR